MPSKASKKRSAKNKGDAKQVVPESPPAQQAAPTPVQTPMKRRSIIATDLKVALKKNDKVADRSAPLEIAKAIAATPEAALVPNAPSAKGTPKEGKHQKRRSIMDSDLKVGLKAAPAASKKDRSSPLHNYATNLAGLTPPAPETKAPSTPTPAETKRAKRLSISANDIKAAELKKAAIKSDKSAPLANFKAIAATPDAALVPSAPTARGVPKAGKHAKRASITAYDLQDVDLNKTTFRNDRSDPILLHAAHIAGATPVAPAAKAAVPIVDAKTAAKNAKRGSITTSDLRSKKKLKKIESADRSDPLLNYTLKAQGAAPPAPVTKTPVPEARTPAHARRASLTTQDLKSASLKQAKDKKDRSDPITNFQTIAATPEAEMVPAAPASAQKPKEGKHSKRRSIINSDLKIGLKHAEATSDRSNPLSVLAAKNNSRLPDAPPAKDTPVVSKHAKRASISVQDIKSASLKEAKEKKDRSDPLLSHATIAKTSESDMVPSAPTPREQPSKNAKKNSKKKARKAAARVARGSISIVPEDLKLVELQKVKEQNDRSTPAANYQANLAGLTPAAPATTDVPVSDAKAARRSIITNADLRSKKKLKKAESVDRSDPIANFKVIAATPEATLIPATVPTPREQPKESKHAKRSSISVKDIKSASLKQAAFKSDRSSPLLLHAAVLAGSTPEAPAAQTAAPVVDAKAANNARRRSVNKHDLRSVPLKKATEAKDRSNPLLSYSAIVQTAEATLVPAAPAAAEKPRVLRHAKNRRSIINEDLNIELKRAPVVSDRSDALVNYAANKQGATPSAPPPKEAAVALSGKAAKHAKRRSVTMKDLNRAELSSTAFKSHRDAPLLSYATIAATPENACVPAVPVTKQQETPRESKHAKRRSIITSDLKVGLKHTETKDRGTPSALYQAKIAGLTPAAPAPTSAPTPLDSKAAARAKRNSITGAQLRSNKKLKATETKADRSAPITSFKAITQTPDAQLVPAAPTTTDKPKESKHAKRRSISVQDVKAAELKKAAFKNHRADPLLLHAADVAGCTPDAPAPTSTPSQVDAKTAQALRRRSIQKHDLRVHLARTAFQQDRSGALLSWAAIAAGDKDSKQ